VPSIEKVRALEPDILLLGHVSPLRGDVAGKLARLTQ